MAFCAITGQAGQNTATSASLANARNTLFGINPSCLEPVDHEVRSGDILTSAATDSLVFCGAKLQITTVKLEKVSKRIRSEEKRRYEDACGIAYAFELIGERWAPLVLRELMFGPRRFSELRSDLRGISANVLTQRLAELEAKSLIRRVQLPPPASVQVYEATGWGLELAPVIRSLGRWAVQSPGHDPRRSVSAVSMMMSLQAMFDAEAAGNMATRIGFRFGNTEFVADIRDGAIDIRRGSSEDVDVLFVMQPGEFAGLLYGGIPLEALTIKGDMEVAKRFVTLFPLPPKIG